VLTDAFGVFDAGYRRGRERLVLRGAGLVPEVVEVELGREDVMIERLMQPAEGEITGRVRDGNDRPIEGVRVTLMPDDGLTATTVVWTDERGLFDLSELAPGAAQIELEHPDYAPTSRDVRVARRGAAVTLELRMALGWSLDLSVVARGNGEPIAGARIEVDDQLWATDVGGEVWSGGWRGTARSVVVRAGGWVAQSQVVTRPEGGRRRWCSSSRRRRGWRARSRTSAASRSAGPGWSCAAATDRCSRTPRRRRMGAGRCRICRRATWWSRRSRRRRWRRSSRL
jgi:hypothetical protein